MWQLGKLVVIHLALASLFGLWSITEANRNTICETPNNVTALCVRLSECKPLYDMLLTGSAENRTFLMKSQCGSDEAATEKINKVLVCCPLNGITLQKIPRAPDCGKHFASRIFGGTAAHPLEYPWMAIIRYKKISNGLVSSNCAGSLISKRYVLTAAHCVKNPVVPATLQVYSVLLGEHNTETDPDCVQISANQTECSPMAMEVLAEKVSHHPLYDYGSTSQLFDIALVRLQSDVQFTPNVFPICLPLKTELWQKEFQNESLEIAGWGSTEQEYSSNIKLKAVVRGANWLECQEVYRKSNLVLMKNQLCAGGDNSADSCRGDSGGPLMATLKDFYYAVGIVSYGPKPCALEGHPAVYTRVGSFLPWILNTILD